ncbi:MAG TPA: hypothetical protein PLC48_00840 [Ferruginibacter sp.]|nr:hypothetical protein [Ferruginibacter sp.]
MTQKDDWVNEVMKSFDDAKRASPKPFLLTRIQARMKQSAEADNIWTQTASFLSRPGIAFTAVLMVVLLNAVIIFGNAKKSRYTESGSQETKDEFAVNVISIYEVENQ